MTVNESENLLRLVLERTRGVLEAVGHASGRGDMYKRLAVILADAECALDTLVRHATETKG